MNIFVVSDDPQACARVLDNRRLNKMVLETAQLLSTAIWERGGEGPYRRTHVNHPCAVWARETRENYAWLLEYFRCVLAEYFSRTGKIHACSQLKHALYEGMALMPKQPRTPFVNCTPHKDRHNTFEAYEATLMDKWINDTVVPKFGEIGR